MKDTELRGVILGKYYERRRGSIFTPKPEDFIPSIPIGDILAISDQLGEHGLLDWKAIKRIGNITTGIGKITAFGIDVAEGAAQPDIKVEFVQTKNVNVTGSSNVVVGDNNHTTVTQHISEFARLIDNSSGNPEQKAEAKGLLRQPAEHPLIAAIAGGATALLSGGSTG